MQWYCIYGYFTLSLPLKWGAILPTEREVFLSDCNHSTLYRKRFLVAISPLVASLFVHAAGILLLGVEFQGPNPRESITPIELVGTVSHLSRGSTERSTKSHRPDVKRASRRVNDSPLHSQKDIVSKKISPSLWETGLNEKAHASSAFGDATSSGSGALAASALQVYVSLIVQKVDEVKIYPEEAVYRGEEGRVVVLMEILPDGKVNQFHLMTPCPFDALNHAALDTLAQLSYLPPLPSGMNRALKVQVPLSFVLSKRR